MCAADRSFTIPLSHRPLSGLLSSGELAARMVAAAQAAAAVHRAQTARARHHAQTPAVIGFIGPKGAEARR